MVDDNTDSRDDHLDDHIDDPERDNAENSDHPADAADEGDQYKVGYGRPPKPHQFPKGRSGNPKGRPKGARGLKTDLKAELTSLVAITENGKTKKITKQQVVLKSLVAKAAKGDTKAAYGYLSPASREVTSLERFQAKTNTGSFRAVKLDGVSCEAETCRVRLFLTLDHRQMTGLTVPLEERWVIADRQAWFVYRE